MTLKSVTLDGHFGPNRPSRCVLGTYSPYSSFVTFSPALRKNVTVVAFLSLLLSLLTVTSQPAFAAPAGTLTIDDGGGGSLPTPSGGVYDIQSNITVTPADIETALGSGDVTLWATSIIVQSDIDGPNANSLTLKASANITVDEGVRIINDGGDVIFWADSDSNSDGYILLGTSASSSQCVVDSNGGDIVLGGRSNPLTDFASGGTSIPVSTKPIFGVGIWGCSLDAGGGDISIRGSTGVSSNSVRAVLMESQSQAPNNRTTITTTGSGSVLIYGDASQSATGANPWGPTGGADITTDSGDVSIIGKSDNASGSARYGVVLATFSITSTSGNVLIQDETPGSNSNSSGFYIAGGSNSITTSGSITVKADKYLNIATLTVSTGTFSVVPYTDSSFDNNPSLGDVNASNASSVTFGASGNTANLTVNNSLSVNGPLTIHAGNVAISAATTATTVNLFSSGATTQSQPITATNLALNGSGSFTLTNTSNNLGTIAGGASGSKLGSVSVYDASGGLTIGTVGLLEGITATGDVLVETGAGDITLAKNIATDSTSSSAITLNAGDSTAAGTSTGGNIVVSGSPTLSTGANGIVRLFSGIESNSTGLTTLAGGSSNVYYGVDENSTLSPTLSAGESYALYRGCASSEPTFSSGGVDYQALVFNNSCSFDWTVPSGVTAVDVLVIGGGGGSSGLAGGGAGEFVQRSALEVSGTLAVRAGAGGVSVPDASTSGTSSLFGGLEAAGGGPGGKDWRNGLDNLDGGSTGGSNHGSFEPGASIDDSDADSFGFAGSKGFGITNSLATAVVGGGGGGAGGTPANASSSGGDATSVGGTGRSSSILPSAIASAHSVGQVSGGVVYFAGGGGGGCGYTGTQNGRCGGNLNMAGGLGGGGTGMNPLLHTGSPATGGGGGGTSTYRGIGGAGGSGVVIVRYVVPVTVTPSANSGGSSGDSSARNPVVPPTTPVATPRQTRLTLVGPNTNPVPRPVERLGLRFDPDAPSRATVGGVPANLVKTPVGSDGLSVTAGAFQFGVSLADADGAEVQTDTPSQSPELFVPRGQSAAVSGKGSYPGSFVQLFLPGNGNDSRELARIPVRSDGTFASDLSFQAGALELPVPIGRQVLQVVGYDELGNQTVVDMTVNIGQGVPAPEPNRQAGALPALTAGQSLATSGGIPETVSVTGVPEAGNVVVEGSGWVISVNADRDDGVVETSDGNVLVRLNPSSVGTTSGNGFLPGTLATVWLFSEPTLVATVSVNDAGEFSAEFLVDARLIAPGEHTLQVQGVGSDGYIKAANLGVLVEQPVEVTAESASGLLWWIVGAFLLVLLFLLLLLARRRRSQEQ